MINFKHAKSNYLFSYKHRLGADHLISYKKTPDYAALVKELTNGKGANVILDPILASNFDYVKQTYSV